MCSNLKALSTGLALLIAVSPALQARAGDFAHTQKTYVPPSFIDRRVDFSSLREHQALENSDSDTDAATAPPASPAHQPDTANHASSATHSASAHSPSIHPVAHTTAQSAGSASSGQVKHPHSHLSAPHTVAAIAASRNEVLPPPSLAGINLARAQTAVQQHLHKIATSATTAADLASLKKQADDLIRSGRLDEAKHTVARLLQLSPHDKQLIRDLAAVSVERAKQLASTQNFDQATLFARQALSIDTNSPEARKMLDGLLSHSGENPADVATRLKNAAALSGQGRNEEASVEFDEALKLKPSAEAHIGLGNIAARANQKEKARGEYLQALEVNPSSAAAHRQLGLLKYNAGDLVGANSELSRSLIMNSQDTEAARSLVDLWQRQVSRVPNANSHLGLARAYQLSGNLPAAQTEYRAVVQMDPQNPHLPAARQAFKLALARHESARAATAARTLEDQGALMDAYGKIIEAQRLSPGDAELRVYQGHLLERMQKTTDARRAYLDALKLNPEQLEAASRLNSLPADDSALTPGGNFSNAGFSPVQSASDPILASAMAGQGAPAVGPPDGVAQLSNFAVQLRNHIVVQKSAIQKVEDVVRSTQSPDGPLGSIPGLGGLPGLHGLGTASESLASATPATDGMSGSVSSTLASAASAIAAAKGLTGKGPAPKAAASTPPSAATAPSGITETLAGASPLDNTYSKVTSLQNQNKNLQQQLNKMTQGAHAVSMNPANSIDAMPPLAPPIAVPGESQSLDRILATQPAQGLPQADPAPALTPLPINEAPSDMVPETTSQSQPTLQPPITAPPAAVKLALEAANVKMTGVELSVILRNDGDTNLVLPDKMRAIIKYANRKDAEVKAVFANASVPAHGQVRGTIKVPFDKVDPNADLVLPGLLPPGATDRDVHLTTPVATL